MEDKIFTKNEQESRWDMKAHGFNKNQNQSKQQLPQNVVSYLMHELSEVQSIMDVGGGAGRYALLFSDYVKEILMTDISGNMLNYAKENAESNGKRNIRFKKVDFETVSDAAFSEEKFDLVFASMCPVTRSNEGIDKMMKFSNGYCAIHQFILSKDSFIEQMVSLKKTFEVEIQEESPKGRKDPHNDRSSVLRIFQYLWENGYNPQIKYFSEDNEEVLSPNDLMIRYKENQFMENLSETLKDKLMETILFDKNQMTVTKNVKSALIYWHI